MTSTLISRGQLGTYAHSLLDFLEEKNITQIERLEQMMDAEYAVGENDEYIHLHQRPSNGGTFTYTISYMVSEVGIPIEVKLNSQLGYSQVIVKGDFTLREYEIFARDAFGNKIQNKRVGSTDLSEIREEIRHLANLT